jgi:hypothetical protein
VNSIPTFASTLHFSPQDTIPSVAFSPIPRTGKRREADEDRPCGRSRDDMLMRKLSTGSGGNSPDADSDKYISARRKLKRAVLEHYRCVSGGYLRWVDTESTRCRGLELLDNYRVSLALKFIVNEQCLIFC